MQTQIKNVKNFMKFIKLLKSRPRNPGDGKLSVFEKSLANIKFNVFKFGLKSKPKNPKEIMIICCFSEFGCETISSMYCIPRIIEENKDKYIIVVGWYGRDYLYRHLVDEFWEIDSDFMWLREKARAFHYESFNLSVIEKKLEDFGFVVPSSYLGRLAISAKCNFCDFIWNTVYADGKYESDSCPVCLSKDVVWPIMGDVEYWKHRATRIPMPSKEKNEFIKKKVLKNSVGIFARNRRCYGRNLQPEFYKSLIYMLKNMGYNPIWIGEKESTLPCPDSSVFDFSKTKESRDLEFTFSVIQNCKFTIQFWTASSRFSGLMGIPYLLFESPDQIWGKGQEGIRRNLCDFGPRKLSINHYLNVFNDNSSGLNIVKKCIEEMEQGNYNDNIGMVENIDVVLKMRQQNRARIGDQ